MKKYVNPGLSPIWGGGDKVGILLGIVFKKRDKVIERKTKKRKKEWGKNCTNRVRKGKFSKGTWERTFFKILQNLQN